MDVVIKRATFNYTNLHRTDCQEKPWPLTATAAFTPPQPLNERVAISIQSFRQLCWLLLSLLPGAADFDRRVAGSVSVGVGRMEGGWNRYYMHALGYPPGGPIDESVGIAVDRVSFV